MSPAADEIYAHTYDSAWFDWPGERAAYLRWARMAASGRRPRVLEVACGTGRVAIPLADGGCAVCGVDASAAMIEVARSKRPDGNPEWIVADMRSFDIGEQFDIALLPAHAFQFMCSADDQVAALGAVRRHLEPQGRLVVHLDRPDHAWLAGLPEVPPDAAAWEVGKARRDPRTGAEWHMRFAWTLDRGAEVATLHLDWIRVEEDGALIEAVAQDPMALKVIGCVEMEHALCRAGFEVEAMLEDFDESSHSGNALGQMIWVAVRSGGD